MGVFFPDEDWDPELPDDGDELWRYVDFTQFVSILQTNELWFAAADAFLDSWEGGLTSEQIDRIEQGLPPLIDSPREAVRGVFDALRATTYVSCWHQRPHETAAMWELYNDRGKEVAIKTSVEKLRASLEIGDDMTMGLVNYKEYSNGVDEFPISRESPFFHKRMSFSHEEEFRVIKTEMQVPEASAVTADYKERVAEEAKPGCSIQVESATLIEEVVVSPVAGKWILSLVEDVLDTYEIDGVNVRPSRLSHDPFQGA